MPADTSNSIASEATTPAADSRQTAADSVAGQPGERSPVAKTPQPRSADGAANQRPADPPVSSNPRVVRQSPPIDSAAAPRAKRPSKMKLPSEAGNEHTPWPACWKRWLVSNDAFGYATSLALHLILLVLLSIWFVDEVGSGTFSTLASQSDNESIEFDKLLDTRMDLAGGETQVQQLPELAVVEAPDSELQLPIDTDLLLQNSGDFEGEAEEGDDSGTGYSPPSGGNAVTKGSFTVWAEPVNPGVNEPYTIFIRVRLPDRKWRYRANDLSGIVLGTDAHEQRIPWDPRWPGAALKTKRNGEGKLPLPINGYLPVKQRHALLMVRVPGARIPKTEDTIVIESKLLKERQTLRIVFGARLKGRLP